MIGLVLAVVLQTSAPQAAPVSSAAAQGAAQPAAAQGETMSCVSRNRRERTCTTAEGEVLRCQRQRELGSRFQTWVCLTAEEEQTLERDSQSALDRQQHITTPGGG